MCSLADIRDLNKVVSQSVRSFDLQQRIVPITSMYQNICLRLLLEIVVFVFIVYFEINFLFLVFFNELPPPRSKRRIGSAMIADVNIIR